MKTITKIVTWIGISFLIVTFLAVAFYWVKGPSRPAPAEKAGLPEETPNTTEVSKIEQDKKRTAELKNEITKLQKIVTELEKHVTEFDKLKKQGVREEKEKVEPELPTLAGPPGGNEQQETKPADDYFKRESRAIGTKEFLNEELATVKTELDRLNTELMQLEASLGPTEIANPFLLIDNVLESFEFGTIAFNAPTSMNLNDLALIQLLLSFEKSIEELSKMVTAAGEKEGARIQVSNRMEARLSAAGFQITAVTPEEQAIASKGNTEWKWEVKPTNAGLQHLHLTLTAIFNVENTSMRRAIRTYDKTIEVRVTWGQRVSGFIGKNWQWLWATLLIPIAGFLWKICKSRVANKFKMQQKSDDSQQNSMQ